MMSTTKSVFLTALNGSNVSFSDLETKENAEGDEDGSSLSSSDASENEDEGVDTIVPVDLKTYQETPKWRRKNLPWATGQDIHSDEYDTDLEEDFPPGK